MKIKAVNGKIGKSQFPVIQKTYFFYTGYTPYSSVGCFRLQFKISTVAESSEIPLLPVSSIKLSVSGKSSSCACNITTPPVSWVKEILVNKREAGSINSSWALAYGYKQQQSLPVNLVFSSSYSCLVFISH